MRRLCIWSVIVAAFLSTPLHAQDRYVGTKTCARCHGGEGQGSPFHVWQTSRHAEAYRSLGAHTERQPRTFPDLQLWVVEIGRGTKYGLPKPAAESKECLPCHTTAFRVDPALVLPSFDPKDGVQCESCHGPGSGHVQAVAAQGGGKGGGGLRRFENEHAIEARCRTCHEGTCGDFDFARMWPAIRHVSTSAH